MTFQKRERAPRFAISYSSSPNASMAAFVVCTTSTTDDDNDHSHPIHISQLSRLLGLLKVQVFLHGHGSAIL